MKAALAAEVPETAKGKLELPSRTHVSFCPQRSVPELRQGKGLLTPASPSLCAKIHQPGPEQVRQPHNPYGQRSQPHLVVSPPSPVGGPQDIVSGHPTLDDPMGHLRAAEGSLHRLGKQWAAARVPGGPWFFAMPAALKRSVEVLCPLAIAS